MLHHQKTKWIITYYVLLILTPITWAKDSTIPAVPYYFVADSVTYLSKAHTITYTGHVKVDQGTTHITGDILVLELTTDNKVTKMIDTGHPATYTAPMKNRPGTVYAKANKITYEQLQDTIYLDGNAFVDQDHNTIRAEHIRYDRKNGIIHTKGSAQNKMTYIVVQPNETQTKKKNPSSAQKTKKSKSFI